MYENKVKKIGIMGGSFNPIHKGHLLIAEQAAKQLGLDEILFIPTGNPPHKDIQLFQGNKHRVEMINLAIQDYPFFHLSRIEIDKKDVSFTYRTLELLKEKNDSAEYYFIMGADSLFNFESWKRPERILDLCTVVAAVRDDKDLKQLDFQIEYLKNKYDGKIMRLNSPKMDVSSRRLRENIRLGKNIGQWVPKKVDRYIIKNHLYKE